MLQFGHLSKDCAEPKRELTCLKCKGVGHTQKHCTKTTEIKMINVIIALLINI